MPKGNYQKIQESSSPSSPVIEIKAAHPIDLTNKSVVFTALIDSGSPVTVVPESSIKELKNLPHRNIQIKSPLENNVILERRMYTVKIEFGGYSHTVEVLTIPREYGIVGRDILNQYKITLNGPEETWSLE